MPGKIYLAQKPPGDSASFLPVHWGVDSLLPPFVPPSDSSRLDALVAAAGRAPEFWGRYIGQFGNLTQSEVDFLHSRNCRVLLIYRDTAIIQVIRGNPPTQPPIQPISSYTDGIAHAERALDDIVARGLRVPDGKNVWIYADIEYNPAYPGGWPDPTEAFFRGWSDRIAASPYGAGVYMNTAQTAHSTPFCCAYNTDTLMRVPGAPALVWTNQPNKCAGAGCDPREYADPKIKRPPYTPTFPRCNRLSAPCGPLVPDVVIYQYALDLSITGGVPVDYDLANEMGFRKMWAPPWEAYQIDLHNDVNNSGIVCAPSLERLPDGRLVAVLAVAHVPNDIARLGAYVSGNDGLTWAAPVELTSFAGGLPETMVERGGHVYVFAIGIGTDAERRRIYQAKFDTTNLVWFNFGTEQSPLYWRVWYDAPGTGTQRIRFPRASRNLGRTQAGIALLHSGVGLSKFVPIAANGDAGTAETIPIGGSTGALNLWWPSDAAAVRMRPIDQLQYVNGQLFFDPAQPQFVDVFKRVSGSWSLDSTYTVDSLDKLVTPTNQDVMRSLRRGLWPVDLAWGGGTMDGADIHGLFSDDPLRPDAGGLSGFLTARWRRQVTGAWAQETVEFSSLAKPLTDQGYNQHSQAMYVEDTFVRGVVQMAGPSYPGNGSYWYVRRKVK